MRGDLHKWVATVTNIAALSAILCLQVYGRDLGLVKDPIVRVQVVQPSAIQGTVTEGREVLVTVTRP